jgi:proteasome lid subunit RPN8/RPN11
MLTISKEVYEEMIKHCFNSLPYEACGILAGVQKATHIYKIRNIEQSSVSYFMDPFEQLKAMKDMRTKNINIIAIYHSHPYGIAYPSQKDRELAIYEVYYLIIALEPKIEVRAFIIKNKEFFEAVFKIEEND